MARALSQLFGCGSGRVLLRCIQAFDSDSSAPAAAQMSGTRQGEAITRIAENLVRNYRTYSLSLHARILRKQQGHGSQPLSNLLGVGRRLLSADFLIYLLLFKDLMRSQRRFVLKIQKLDFPWEAEAAFQEKQKQVQEDMELLSELRQLVAVSGLLQHYIDPCSLRCMLRAMLYTPVGKRFPGVLHALPDVISDRKFQAVI